MTRYHHSDEAQPHVTDVDVLIVGLGFAGATTARALADAGLRVHAVDRREHIGGNAFDHPDDFGVLVHRYGPHLFHTSSTRVVGFLSRFTEWREYEHRVLALVEGQLVPFPVNRRTINLLYGLDLDSAGVSAHLERVREVRTPILTSEDVVLRSVGHDLCEKLFRGYTRKHWGCELSELQAGVAARIPVRADDDDRYFQDSFQCIPAAGYTKMFERMLEHPLISFETGRDWAEIHTAVTRRHLVFTGPIDAYFDYCHGRLPYRSVRFEHEHLADVEHAQPVATINFPNDYEYTRSSEFKHITGQTHHGTSILREYPCADGDPFYPIPCAVNEQIYRRYHEMAADLTDVTFVGRLAQYRYYDMDQVVAAALAAAPKIVERVERFAGRAVGGSG